MPIPEYRLPPDVSITECTTALSETYSWAVEFLGIENLWSANSGILGTRPARVAILDTGVDDSHPDLSSAIVAAEDFTGSSNGPRDINGHGTWCAGCVAALPNNIGVRGISHSAKIYSGKVLGDSGSGTDHTISAGIAWAIEEQVDFISLSLGGPRMGKEVHEIIKEAVDSGIFVFGASGNDGGRVNYPAAFREVIAVGAVNKDGSMTDFTSNDRRLDCLAPGYELLSTLPGNRYGRMTGTSMSCPIATACSVLGRGFNHEGPNPIDTYQEMRERIKSTSRPTDSGFGLIDPVGLVGGEVPDETEEPENPPLPSGKFRVNGSFDFTPLPS